MNDYWGGWLILRSFTYAFFFFFLKALGVEEAFISTGILIENDLAHNKNKKIFWVTQFADWVGKILHTKCGRMGDG